MTKDDSLKQLTARLQQAFGDQVVAVILYGSGAGDDYDEAYSDLNVMCVLNRLSVAELAAAASVFHWWRGLGHPAPLLVTEQEVAGSTDCFAIEYQDMIDRRIVLAGKDVIHSLAIDRSFYRAQVEYELRSRLVRLRQKAAGVLEDKRKLVRLMTDSVTTFLVLARHALALAGTQASSRREGVIDALESRFAIDPSPFRTLVDVRTGKRKPATLDAKAVFAQYLRSAGELVAAVDRLEK